MTSISEIDPTMTFKPHVFFSIWHPSWVAGGISGMCHSSAAFDLSRDLQQGDLWICSVMFGAFPTPRKFDTLWHVIPLLLANGPWRIDWIDVVSRWVKMPPPPRLDGLHGCMQPSFASQDAWFHLIPKISTWHHPRSTVMNVTSMIYWLVVSHLYYMIIFRHLYIYIYIELNRDMIMYYHVLRT